MEIGLLLAEEEEETKAMPRGRWRGERGKRVKVSVGSLPNASMTGKGRVLAGMLKRRKVDILYVPESRWKGSKARRI